MIGAPELSTGGKQTVERLSPINGAKRCARGYRVPAASR